MTVLSINYYDTYPVGSPSAPSQIRGQNVLSQNAQTYDISTKSLPTASFIKNIENDNWTKNFLWYDGKGRIIKAYTINHMNGYTTKETKFDFAGIPQENYTHHKRTEADNEITIGETYEYDTQNRLKKHWHRINNNPAELLTENIYNELSQIINKKTGGGLQDIIYSYNLHGSLTKINDPVTLNGKLFGYEIKYQNPTNTSAATIKFNGSITEVDWKTANDEVLRRYSYQYDQLDRLLKGTYSEVSVSVPRNDFFNESQTYDSNGNIMSLKRYAPHGSTTPVLIDNLSYTYSGNQLHKVQDITENYSGYPIGGNLLSYDVNGNMTSHTDKGISSIQYNFLNLATIIVTAPDRNLQYFYSADGTKLKKILEGKIVDYLGGFQYENGILQFFSTSEGYYDFTNTRYVYNYTDHLGNIRLSYTKSVSGFPQVLEENNYYPFGLKHTGYNTGNTSNPAFSYKYNGKELQTETGMIDYGWRQYMPEIGRWNGIDQLAENYISTSTYAYVANNPVLRFDVDGRWFNEDGTIDTSGKTPGFVSGKHYLNTFLGNNKNDVGGGSAVNIIINFLRNDKQVGNFVNSEFVKNGWYIIDAESMEDALTKLKSYLGDNLADNIFINAHGFESQRYILNEKGEAIRDPKTGQYKMIGDNGFHTLKDGILGSHLQQYISDKSSLSSDMIKSINSFIEIANYVRDGKNLIVASCNSVRYDDLFGVAISSIVKSKDIFVNRDYTSMHFSGTEGKEYITYQDFTSYNQTSQKYYIHGWVWFRDGIATQRNFNIKMNNYGVKTIK